MKPIQEPFFSISYVTLNLKDSAWKILSCDVVVLWNQFACLKFRLSQLKENFFQTAY